MQDRERRLLDAAIGVLGDGGARQLTHRAVDARAGLPAGSASNCFRTRAVLLSAVLRRILEREGELWTRAAAGLRPESTGAVAAMLGQLVAELSGSNRELTVARHAVFAEAATDAVLRAALARAQQELILWLVPLLAELGSPDPARHSRYLLALIDGLLAAQLASPVPGFDPQTAIAALLRGLTSQSTPEPAKPPGQAI